MEPEQLSDIKRPRSEYIGNLPLLQVLKIDIEGSEWGLFKDFYENPGATLPATNLVVEFHMPNTVAEVFAAIDAILADGFR